MKKAGALKISHEAFRANKNAEMQKEHLAGFATVLAEKSEWEAGIKKIVEDLNPLKVLELFKRVTAEVS